MKLQKCILVLLAVFSTFSGGIHALAMETGFTTQEMERESQEHFLSNINLSLLDSPIEHEGISCFDVNEEFIAVGFAHYSKRRVCVYTLDGVFQYGYSFECYGDFDLEWEQKNLIIHFVRGDIAASFDSNANCIEVRRIEDTFENNSYWNKQIRSTRKKVGNCQYRIRNDMGLLNITATSYSQLVKIEEDGTESILYDVNDECLAQTIFGLIVCVLFVAVALTCVITNMVKSQKKNRV